MGNALQVGSAGEVSKRVKVLVVPQAPHIQLLDKSYPRTQIGKLISELDW
jgi:hypothetical protein